MEPILKKKPSERKVIVAVLLTSALLTMLALTGIFAAMTNLSNQPIPSLQSLQPNDGSILRQDPRTSLVLEAQATNPLRRPFAAANLILSTLLLVGSFMLSWRRKIAFWWIQQTVMAKVLWIIVDTINVVHHLHVTFPTLYQHGLQHEITLTNTIKSAVLLGLLSVVLHVGAAWRASRPDIQAFITQSRRI